MTAEKQFLLFNQLKLTDSLRRLSKEIALALIGNSLIFVFLKGCSSQHFELKIPRNVFCQLCEIPVFSWQEKYKKNCTEIS